MEAVVRCLRPGGRLIASVPNAESPDGLRCLYTDITHEMAFTAMSFEEMLFCHGLKLVSLRDPWPAPLDAKRRVYRWLVQGAGVSKRSGFAASAFRRLESGQT